MTRGIVWLSLALGLAMPTAWATCVEVPAPGVPRHMRQSVGLTLVRAAGLTGTLTDGQGFQIGQSHLDTACLPTEDPTGILTDAAMLSQYQADEAVRHAAGQAEAARQTVFENEITGNTLCTAELSDIDSRLDALIDPVSNLAEAKTAMKTGLKKIARCLRAHNR